jgi:hypothetical protein
MSGIGWSEVNPGLIRIFGALALPSSSEPQKPNWSAEWKDRPLAATPDKGPMKGTSLFMRTTSVIGIGDDDRRLEFIPANATPATQFNNSYQETLYGLRRVTLNLEAQMSEISDGLEALPMLERIRTRLRRRHVIDDLEALNVALVRCMASQILPTSKDGQRVKSRAQMDVILTMVSSDTDPVPTGWIAQLVISSAIQNTDGTVLPVPPNVTNRIINLP